MWMLQFWKWKNSIDILLKEISLLCDLKDLAFMGSGYPLYFRFIKSCILTLLIIFIVQGIYGVKTYL